jgi:SNF2 family DNA or RNA helicase
MKRDVMPQLHLPVYDLIQIEDKPGGQAIKQALKAESLLDINPENLQGLDAEVLGHVSSVRKQMGVAMAPQAADHIEMLLDGGEEKLVVFAWHTEVMDILAARLSKYGLVRIDGSTSASKKERMVKSFIENSSVQIALGNLLSMGVGTDGLQLVSSHALIVEPDWTPGNNIQAFDRLDRGGQTRQVQGDIFVVPGSFAERVLGAALFKNQSIHKALDRRYV